MHLEASPLIPLSCPPARTQTHLLPPPLLLLLTHTHTHTHTHTSCCPPSLLRLACYIHTYIGSHRYTWCHAIYRYTCSLHILFFLHLSFIVCWIRATALLALLALLTDRLLRLLLYSSTVVPVVSSTRTHIAIYTYVGHVYIAIWRHSSKVLCFHAFLACFYIAS